MAQQKKTTDKNIYDIARQLEKTAKASIDDAFKELQESIDTIKESLKAPIEHIALINKILSISIEKLHKTSKQLEKEL